jgi:hypothetical protein
MVPGKMETRNVSFRVSILDPSVHEYVPDNRFELVRGTRSFVLHAVVWTEAGLDYFEHLL